MAKDSLEVTILAAINVFFDTAWFSYNSISGVATPFKADCSKEEGHFVFEELSNSVNAETLIIASEPAFRLAELSDDARTILSAILTEQDYADNPKTIRKYYRKLWGNKRLRTKKAFGEIEKILK